MRRVDFQGEEYLIHTKSGHRLKDSLADLGVPVNCECAQGNVENCKIKFPKDTGFLLTAPSALEKQTFDATEMAQGWRLACQPLWK